MPEAGVECCQEVIFRILDDQFAQLFRQFANCSIGSDVISNGFFHILVALRCGSACADLFLMLKYSDGLGVVVDLFE